MFQDHLQFIAILFTQNGLRSDIVIIMYFIPTYHETVRRQTLLPWLTLYVHQHLNFAGGHQNPAYTV